MTIKTKKYEVTTPDGRLHMIEATYAFVNEGDLVFRQGQKGDTEITAAFARGSWSHYLKID